MSDDEILVRREGAAGRLTLNRPRALHALTLGMCETMTEALLAWIDDPTVRLVVLDHAGERGFCAGGDIRRVTEATDPQVARDFFGTEYRLNHLMFVYPKPIAALMDGVTMGGGVGISQPARIRVATERTLFAMPETGIGLFPDVGGGWHLPRLPGAAGVWLGLTGARLKAADCLGLGIATHFVPSDRLAALTEALVAAPDDPAAVVGRFSADPGPPPLAEHRAEIDRLFQGASVEEILAALEADGGGFARSQAEVLGTRSPLSLKVSLRQMQLGAAAPDFAAEMAQEYRTVLRMVAAHDFREGVRAVLVDKDNRPAWSPSTLLEVKDAHIEAVVEPLPPDQEWTPLERAKQEQNA